MVDHPAIENLRANQRQLDHDGVEVGVSRQALDEVLAMITSPIPEAGPKIRSALLAASAMGLKQVSIEIEPGLRQIWIAGETIPD